MERQFNAIDKNSYEQIQIQSSAEDLRTYDELFAIPINDTESITLKTDEEVCSMITFDSNFFFLRLLGLFFYI